MADFENLGRALTLVRELRGLSQAEVARRARIGKSQMSKYESGKELPKLGTLAVVLRVLTIDTFQFFYVLHLVEIAATNLSVVDEMAAQGLPPLPMSGQGLLSSDTDEAFKRLVDDVMQVYHRVQWEKLGLRTSGS